MALNEFYAEVNRFNEEEQRRKQREFEAAYNLHNAFPLNADQWQAMLLRWIERYPIVSIEDPFDEIAFDDFAALQSSTDVRLVGDDLTVTNVSRLSQAIEKKCIRALIVKPNQIGTLSETIATMKLARENGIDCIVSHRSGETMDDFVADLAFAFGAFGLKAGALRKPERRTKYERLATIAA